MIDDGARRKPRVAELEITVERDLGAQLDEGTFSPMLAVPGGILLVDAIIALALYLSNDN